MFKRAIAVGAILASGMLAACVVGIASYAVPAGVPTATLTFELAQADAARVSQQIVFLDDKIAMTMPAIYALQNGNVVGPERAGNQFAGRPEQVEAGRRLFVFVKTTVPTWSMDRKFCLGQISFTPIAGHTYTMQHVTNDEGCLLIVRDRATNLEPGDLTHHDPDRVTLPF